MCLCVLSCKCEDSEREKYWKEMNECLKECEEGRKVVVMGDMNAKVGDERIDEVVGQ